MTATLGAPEVIQSDNRTPIVRAQERDLQARSMDGVLKSAWCILALLCRAVERDRDWELLGFHSFNAWVESALPYSRSTVYDALRLVRELSADIPESDLTEIAHDTAHVLLQLPSAIRRNPETIAAAKASKPGKFREQVAQEHPEAHIETKVKQIFYFEESQWRHIKSKIGMYRIVHNSLEMTYEECVEGMCEEWSQSYDEH